MRYLNNNTIYLQNIFNMLDILHEILLYSSPLKKKAVKKVGGFLFGDNSDKNAGKDQLKKDMKALDGMIGDMKKIDTSNPYANATNAFSNLSNTMSGLDNVYDDAENVYEGKMKNAFEGQKNAYDGMKNQMEGMENAFEDLTVNTQQAEFEAQQNQQMQSNIMSQMSGAAGGSGIAALAQSMANQGALQASKASASIGAQESSNQAKAADAEQKINMATADEASKIQTMQRGEAARLDDQKRSADMDIQNKILGADEALQAQRLGEASKLQMAEAEQAASNQMAAAQGEMDVQKLKGEGAMWSTEQEMGKAKTAMEIQMSKVSLSGQQANQPKDRGLLGNLFSDERLKENIVRLGHTFDDIPIYKFNYIGDDTLHVGTMAQDLLKMGREDAVGMRNGFYTVDYNSINVNMASPLKQIDQQAANQKAQANVGMMDAGMDILSEAQRRKNWEELQKYVRDNEPIPMQLRKEKDRVLRQNMKDKLGEKAIIQTPGVDGVANSNIYMKILTEECKRLQKEIYKAIQDDDKETEMDINQRMAGIKRISERFREETQEFYDDHFTPDSHLSKGTSKQQVSFGTQIFCDNPEANMVIATKRDVDNGTQDYYNKPVVDGAVYALCYDFTGEPCMINVLDGNKETWITDMGRVIEYIGFLTEINKDASESKKNGEVSDVKPVLGRINYKLDMMFGLNDGTATWKHNQLVMQFAHDSHIMKDGSSFLRHLYEHPNIQNLNYGGFDWESMEFKRDLGPGDKLYWTDNLDVDDRIALIDALTNSDNQFFDMDLLRTLVKEYYAYKIENAWWKGMGFDEGKLTVMRLKQKELAKQRFERDRAKAMQEGRTEFEWDGQVFPTGLDVEKAKKEEEKTAAANKKQSNINK